MTLALRTGPVTFDQGSSDPTSAPAEPAIPVAPAAVPGREPAQVVGMTALGVGGEVRIAVALGGAALVWTAVALALS